MDCVVHRHPLRRGCRAGRCFLLNSRNRTRPIKILHCVSSSGKTVKTVFFCSVVIKSTQFTRLARKPPEAVNHFHGLGLAFHGQSSEFQINVAIIDGNNNQNHIKQELQLYIIWSQDNLKQVRIMSG